MKKFITVLMIASFITGAYASDSIVDFADRLISATPIPEPPPPQSLNDNLKEAWISGDHYSALNYQLELTRLGDKHGINAARNSFVLAMCYWNVNNKYKAIAEVEKGIYFLRTEKYTAGSGCEKVALDFLRRMRNGLLPSKFNYYDTYTEGALGYIMAIPDAVFHKNISNHTQRLKVLTRYLEIEIEKYQRKLDYLNKRR